MLKAAADVAVADATAAVVDADAAVAVNTQSFALAADVASINEGGGIKFTVTAALAVDQDTVIVFKINTDGAAPDAGGTKANLNDFSQGSSSAVEVTIKKGDKTATYEANPENDGIAEETETFSVTATVKGSSKVVANGTQTVSILDGVAGAGKTFTLTPGVDSGAAFTGGANDDTFNALDSQNNLGTYVATLTALDSLDGGAGTDTLNVITAAALAIPTSVTVKNIETANITTGATLAGDVSAWTGLTKVVATQSGGSNALAFTAAATTDVTLTDMAAAASTTSVQGGKNVNVTLNGVTAAGTLNVGTVAAVKGTVDVTTNMLASQIGIKTADAINVKGGTVVNVTANLTEKADVGNTVTGGAIGVTGTTDTTTVTVKQSAAATAAAEVVAATGVVFKAVVAAASGLDGVVAAAAVAPATAKAAVAGVTNGVVTVTDSAPGALGTIKTVTLENYGATSKVASNALTDLTLKGTAGALTLDRVAASGASDTLNLTLDALSAPTIAGGVVTSPVGGNNTITDTNNEIKTLNVVTAGAKDSTLTAFVDTGLLTLNVSGTKVLALGTVNNTLTKLAVTGAAGFTGDVSGRGAALDFTTTSSGKITATLDAATQKFAGSTGQTDITINADALVAITGGSGSNDKLVLNNTAATFNTAPNVLLNKGLTKMVSGFEVLGTGAVSQGTFDISLLPAGIKSISMDGAAAGVIAFNKLVDNTSLAINASQGAAVTYQLANANGVANTADLTIGSATNATGLTVADLTLKDANDVGVGTLNVTSNAGIWLQKNTISKLTDNGLSTLKVSGNAGLTIADLTQATTQATAFTINNTLAGADDVVEITTLNNANLGSLTFTGAGNSSVGTLGGLTGKVLTVANTGTGTAKVGAIGVTGIAGGTKEINTVKIAEALQIGESITVAGITVQNTGTAISMADVTAADVAIALSGGAVAAGLTKSGTQLGWTPVVTTTDTISYTATTVGDLTLIPTKAIVAAGTTVLAPVRVDGTVATAETETFTMQSLVIGQSVTIAGMTVTAKAAMTANEVAAAFVAGAVGGAGVKAIHAAAYEVSGTYAIPGTWTTPAWTNPAAGTTVEIANGAVGVVGVAGSAEFAATVNTVTTITDPTVTEVIKGAGAGAAAQALTTITMTGDVAWGANDNTTAEAAIGATTGITVDGATNNAHVNIQLNAAAAGTTNTIKLGNANNFITDLTSAGKVVIEVGTGGNLIDIDQGAATTYLADVKLGAHTNTATVFNKILVSNADGQATSYSTVITGAVKGDVIVFYNGGNIVWDAVTAGEQASITGAVNLAAAVTTAFGTLGVAHAATSFVYQGDTYVIQNVAADTVFTTGTDSIIKLTGLVTVGDNGANVGEIVVM